MQSHTWLRRGIGVLLLILVGFCIVAFMQTSSLAEVQTIAAENRLIGAVLLSVLIFCTTVFAPLTSLAAVPLVAPLIGPFTAGTACFIGWILGSMVAFSIGRHLGQPFLSRFMNMDKIRKYESYIKPETSFMLILVIHMVLPIDALNYAFGMFSSVPLRIYALATSVSFIWFSYLFAYAGSALINENYVLLGILGVASVSILYFGWLYARRFIDTPRGED